VAREPVENKAVYVKRNHPQQLAAEGFIITWMPRCTSTHPKNLFSAAVDYRLLL
jgi:hypothetical protein